MFVYMFLVHVYFLADATGEGSGRGGHQGQQMIPSVLFCSAAASAQGTSPLHAIFIIQLFSVGFGKWHILQMSAQTLLKCVCEKGNFRLLTGRGGLCFRAKGVPAFINFFNL